MTYKAKTYYQANEVAGSYDKKRFSSLHGKIAHKNESGVLGSLIERYFKNSGKVLDIPCGTGRMFSLFSDKNYKLVGADISKAMLLIASKRTDNISVVNSDAVKLPFSDNFFDYLISVRLMCHLSESIRDEVLDEMMRVTKDTLIINYHFDVITPLSLFNRIFQPQNESPYPLKEAHLIQKLKLKQINVREIKKLSWYERSSAFVVISKGCSSCY